MPCIGSTYTELPSKSHNGHTFAAFASQVTATRRCAMRCNPLCAMAAGETLTSASSAAGASNGQARAAATSSSLHDVPANAPFTRNDRYGHYGKAPQPLLEQLRLALMTVLVVPVRLGLTICIMLLVNIGCRVSDLLPVRWRPDWCAAVCTFWCSLAAAVLGFNAVWIKVPSAEPEVKPAGIVCNHCSWADILINLAHNCPSFAARDGTQSLPLIGTISAKIQCLFVNRGQKDSTAKSVSALIKERMIAKATQPDNNDRLMLLFPEGTTTNGRYLLPFKTGAFIAGLPLQPVLMHYDMKSPVSPCWDTIKPHRHIWLLLCQPMHKITCYELPVYAPSDAEKADPALYAANMRQYMLKWGQRLGMNLQLSESTFETKMEYHMATGHLKPRQTPSNKVAPSS